ncbi:MAG: CehA/McbA family metallohydrolase [Geodermatophilaceae bacterium]
MTRTVRSGVFGPDDRAESPYVFLHVDVPTGCTGLTVELDYDPSGGVLDLGCFGPNGFRGWSGGARSRYVITPTAATPGYLPGELEPGQWSVVLGLHRVAPTGLPWQVTTVVGPAEPYPESSAWDHRPRPAPERPRRRNLPAEPGWSWLAGDLHAHTVHSDGSLTIDELAALAAAQGLDFLAVTDHNTVSHHPFLATAGARAGLTLIPGQEVTTHRGHANAFGDIGWVDFREPADEWVREVAERGGLLSVNHPLAGDCAWREPLTVRPPLAEIWHWTWMARTWGGPMAWWLAWDPATTPVGGSDFHRPDQGRLPGQPTTWVLCEDDGVEGVLGGLAAGRTSVSVGRNGPVLLRLGDELLAIDAEGAILADQSGRRRVVRGPRTSFPAPAEPGPQWLEDDHTAVLALCG